MSRSTDTVISNPGSELGDGEVAMGEDIVVAFETPVDRGQPRYAIELAEALRAWSMKHPGIDIVAVVLPPHTQEARAEVMSQIDTNSTIWLLAKGISTMVTTDQQAIVAKGRA